MKTLAVDLALGDPQTLLSTFLPVDGRRTEAPAELFNEIGGFSSLFNESRRPTHRRPLAGRGVEGMARLLKKV